MKIYSTLFIPAILCGMFSLTSQAQTINWGAGENVHAMADAFVSDNATSTPSMASGKMESTDATLNSTINPANVEFLTKSQADVAATYKYVNDQLTNASSPVAVHIINDLGNSINNLKPGIYILDGDATIAAGTTLTLNDGGDKNAVYIFKVSGNLLSFGSVKMKSGFTGVNVFFQVNGNSKIENTFQGNLVSNGQIVLNPGSAPTGQMFSKQTIFFSGAKLDIPLDTDHDGINDYLDDYPLDATKAYNNVGNGGVNTVAFEDQWPSKGDFDFNDVVMKTSYNYITNAQNKIVQIIGNFSLLATGGTKKNSFHIRFLGNKFSSRDIDFASVNGGSFEATNSGVSFKLYDNMRNEMVEWNTIPGRPISPVKNYILTFNVLKSAGWKVENIDVDPFIVNFVGASRREVHLPSYDPTSLADPSVLNTMDDGSATTTYTSKVGSLPWAISIPADHFDYPVELKDVTTALLHFGDWAESNPLIPYNDWYSNTATGYRNTSLIFAIPVF